MKKRLVTIALSATIALAATTSLWAQCGKPCCDKAQAATAKCVCQGCAEGKQDAACPCGCNSSKGCDMKNCASCAKKEKSQQKPCCDKGNSQQ